MYIQHVWNTHSVQPFRDIRCCCKNEDLVLTLKTLKKVTRFYRNKGTDILTLGSTLPNMPNICLESSKTSKSHPFLEVNEDSLVKVTEGMVIGPSIVFTRKTVLVKTKIRSPPKFCNSIVDIDAIQLFSYAMCEPMLIGLHTRWEFDVDLKRFKPRSNIARTFEHLFMAYFRVSRPVCKVESFYTTGFQKKNDCFCTDGVGGHRHNFEALGCFYLFCERQPV